MKQTSDTSFAPDWLSLREPADHKARDAALLARAGVLAEGATVLDLGCGTGSTARAFEAAGFRNIHWRFFDQDRTLLQLAQAHVPNAECVVGDIAEVENLPVENVALITASALFDLMSKDWVTALVMRAEEFNVPIYAALTYNGVMTWTPEIDDDATITDAFNAHQRRDKGTGAALGPVASATFAKIAEARGWTVDMAKSPWCLGPNQAALHQQLVSGIGQAAYEAGASAALNWADKRNTLAHSSSARIGHIDVLARPKMIS